MYGFQAADAFQRLHSGISTETRLGNAIARLPAFGAKKSLISGFRIIALLFAVFQLSLDDTTHILPPLTFIMAGVLYTAFKVMQPLHWNHSPRLSLILPVLDLSVCGSLFALSMGIHSPFTLYTLSPVLTSALLFSRRQTLITASATAAYVLFLYLDDPTISLAQHLGSWVSIYVVALVLSAILPYAVNAVSQRRLHFQAMLDERLRLGREIHDELCQDICGLRWELQMLSRDAGCPERLAKRLEYFEGLLERVEKDARESIELLRNYRDSRPFLSQLESYLDRLEKDTGIDCHVEMERTEPKLDNIVKFEVLHICQEALRNVAKHSAARNVRVTVQSPNGHLRISIADDGRGASSLKFMEGRGLMVMKERAESIGGRLELVSAPGKGTEVTVEVPRRCPLEPPRPRQ
ncbi:MAG: sensor histidine kinase [Chloroflexi bacterium]|nr:sensor histidine kinase [Chloroflexota bacterium]